MTRPTAAFAFLSAAAIMAGCGGASSFSEGSTVIEPTGTIAYTLGASSAAQHVFVQNVSAGSYVIQSGSLTAIQPALSPGGAKVAFVSTGEADKEIYIQTVNQDGTLVRLTDNTVDDTEPCFSPTTGEVYFVRKDSGSASSIWKVTQNGATQTKVVSSTTVKYSPSVSPDGLSLAYWELSDGSCRLKVRTLASGWESTVVSGYAASDPAPSVRWMDGGRLLASALVSGVQTVFTVNTDGSGVTVVTEGFRPCLSTDGNRILFGRTVSGGIQAFTCLTGGGSVSQYTVAGTNVSDSWDWSRS